MMPTNFPTYKLKNIQIYYWLAVLLNGWFMISNWVFLFSKYVNRTELGIIEGVAILTGVIMEVPSGALSDMLGKKKTIMLGSLILIAAGIGVIVAKDFWMLLVANTLTFIGFAFHSGSVEAFGYDSLKENGLEAKYELIVGKYTFLAVITTIVATIGGGFMFRLSPTLPYWFWMLFSVTSIILLLQAHEPKIDSRRFTLSGYVNQLKDGTKGLFSKVLLPYLIPVLGLSILIKLYQGIFRQSFAGYFGFNGETFGYLLGLILIPGSILSFKFGELRQKMGDKLIWTVAALMYLVAFGISIWLNDWKIGAGVFLLIMTAERISEPLVSTVINENIDSMHRATILSTKALIAQIPYIILVMSFANLTLLNNIWVLNTIYATIALVILLKVVTYPARGQVAPDKLK